MNNQNIHSVFCDIINERQRICFSFDKAVNEWMDSDQTERDRERLAIKMDKIAKKERKLEELILVHESPLQGSCRYIDWNALRIGAGIAGNRCIEIAQNAVKGEWVFAKK